MKKNGQVFEGTCDGILDGWRYSGNGTERNNLIENRDFLFTFDIK